MMGELDDISFKLGEIAADVRTVMSVQASNTESIGKLAGVAERLEKVEAAADDYKKMKSTALGIIATLSMASGVAGAYLKSWFHWG